MTIDLIDLTTGSLGLSNASVETRDTAKQLLQLSQNVITNIAGQLTRLGSQYSALEHNLDNSMVLQYNLTTIESNIRDADMGKETMLLAINKVLTEATYSLHKFSDDQKQHFEKVLFE
ncbi:flagellin [Neobacillus sp. PS3-34]|uniref:flagellin n=1 Tax=Neobacillus sp. PS3-34 TaxID=3070678 RepID=UPI0035A67F46